MQKLGPQERARLLERFGASYASGQTIFAEGDEARTCCMVHEGRVRLVKRVSQAERSFAVLRPGELFGQQALLERSRRTMSAVALTDCVVLHLERSALRSLVTTNVEVGFRLVELLVERIRDVEEQLQNYYLPDASSRVLHSLLRLMEGLTPTSGGYVLLISPLELAVRTGLDVDSVKTTVQQLKSSGYLQLSDERIVIPRLEPIQRLWELVSLGESPFV